jgi:isopenicillin N synthase-like dioxygenase
MSPAAVNPLKSALNHFRRKLDSHEYEPPTGPPPSKNKKENPGPPVHTPFIQEVQLPLVQPHRGYNLAAQGWTTLTLSPSKDSRAVELQCATKALFTAAQVFFDREDEYKIQFLSTKMGSEEGWNSIPGEKEFYTIRCTKLLPSELRDAAETYWTIAGDLLRDTLGCIAESVELKPEALMRLVDGCVRLGEEQSATMLRVFRYEGWEDKVVAEPHTDLGLLSMVAGQSPGLEVWNAVKQSYYPIEKQAENLAGMASLLAGRQLQWFTNGVYSPGGHLVRAYPVHKTDHGEADGKKRYRFSIVFVLRAHYPVILDKKSLTSQITGEPVLIYDGMTAKDVFIKIKGAHYNINTGIQDREEQKKRLQATKKESIAADKLGIV